MALGIFGGILMGVLILKTVVLSYFTLNNLSEYSWITLIYIQYLVYGMFSGSLYSSNYFWAFLVLMAIQYSVVIKRSDIKALSLKSG
jgi:hypothetical protein